jgi:hypothetical protein
MGRRSRRAAAVAGLLAVFAASAWLAISVSAPDAGEDSGPAEGAGSGETPVTTATWQPPRAGQRAPRRRSEPEPEPEPEPERAAAAASADASPSRAPAAPRIGPGVIVPDAGSAPGAKLDAVARAQAQVAQNVRPTAGVDAATVLARRWSPAKDTFAATSGRRPDLALRRAPADPLAEYRGPHEPITPFPGIDEEQLALATTHGLRGDYYDFLRGGLSTVPEVAAIPPTFSRLDLAVDFDNDAAFALPFEPETFGVRWTGFLTAPEEGTYRFFCGSDDGVRVRIDGTTAVEYAGLRAYAESGGELKLSAGRHEIEIVFYENFVYASCRLWWEGPGFKRRIVAPEFLTPPDELLHVERPAIARVEPAAAFVEDEVTVLGAGFGADASRLRVTFANVPAEIVSATRDRLTVKVPVGAATGDVVVRVGEISSLPRPFEVENLLGLYAEYFKLEGELQTYPDFDHLAPYFVRLDENLAFLEDDHWSLPTDPDVFAVRHTGFLWAPADDDYRLTLGSDDGARVALDGKAALEMPGLHPYEEQARTVRLAKGFHAIEVIFFENYGEARLALFWQRPSEPQRSLVPAGFFYAPREVTDRVTPTVASMSPKAAETGGEIEIKGSGFGSDPRLVRVVFPGDVWARPIAVDDDRLRVRVPYRAQSGDLRVEAGIKSSAPLAFTLATQQGLVADYFTFTDRAAAEAAIADSATLVTRPANFTRTETSWQRTSAKDWDLPFPSDTFIVHWHGTLAAEYPADVMWILRAAAGALLLVDGAVADDNLPWHDLQERYGSSHLTPGEHKFDLWFVQSGAEPRIQLLWTRPGRAEHLPVPANWFLPRDLRAGR